MASFLKFIVKLTLCFVFLTDLGLASSTTAFITGGINYSNLKNSEWLSLNANVTNRYQPKNENDTNALVGAGVMQTFEKEVNNFQLSLGSSIYYFNLSNVKGTLYPFINTGLYDTLQYQFATNNISLFIESRLMFNRYQYKPYLLMGIGSAWNKLFRYQEKPTNPDLSAAPAIQQYTRHTHQDIAYEIGFGVEYPIIISSKNPCIYSLALDYRYFNFGSGNLKSSQPSNDHLKINSIYTQAILLALNVSFR